MIEPNGSMCLRGLRVSRPARLAVSSPHHSATTPWLTSWQMTAGMKHAKKISARLQHVVRRTSEHDARRPRSRR